MKTLWRAEGERMVAGFTCEHGVIVDMAPIFKWTLRLGMKDAQAFLILTRRGLRVQRVGSGDYPVMPRGPRQLEGQNA